MVCIGHIADIHFIFTKTIKSLLLVYSGMIKWIPKGSQNTIYSAEDVGPVENDILISKMRPGHEIDLKLLAVKGVGKDHAKFSPVGMFIQIY